MQRIVLIGAGSANFGLEAVSDIYKSKTLEGSEIVLHDTNQEALKETQEVADKYKEKWGVNFKVSSITNRKEALKDATVVVISIEVTPRFGLWDQDWKIPQQYGMKQIYAENRKKFKVFFRQRSRQEKSEKFKVFFRVW